MQLARRRQQDEQQNEQREECFPNIRRGNQHIAAQPPDSAALGRAAKQRAGRVRPRARRGGGCRRQPRAQHSLVQQHAQRYIDRERREPSENQRQQLQRLAVGAGHRRTRRVVRLGRLRRRGGGARRLRGGGGRARGARRRASSGECRDAGPRRRPGFTCVTANSPRRQKRAPSVTAAHIQAACGRPLLRGLRARGRGRGSRRSDALRRRRSERRAGGRYRSGSPCGRTGRRRRGRRASGRHASDQQRRAQRKQRDGQGGARGAAPHEAPPRGASPRRHAPPAQRRWAACRAAVVPRTPRGAAERAGGGLRCARCGAQVRALACVEARHAARHAAQARGACPRAAARRDTALGSGARGVRATSAQRLHGGGGGGARPAECS